VDLETQTIQNIEIDATKPKGGEKHCLHCEKFRPLSAFSQHKGKGAERRNICQECERLNQQARYRHLETQRARWQLSQAREERRQQAWERSIALRQVYEQRQQEKVHWYRQQPDRRCCTCRQSLPATAFGALSSANGFTLQMRCRRCHEIWHENRQLACCLCQKKVARRDSLSSYDGYALCGDGTWISLYCKECEPTFRNLSEKRQADYIHACCQRSFSVGQVIYAEVDPETNEIRYVGRTGKPKRRHAQHLSDASPRKCQWGAERKAWYTRGNWMYDLAEKELMPSMQILKYIGVLPLVVEWEQRYIWHGIQQGWRLLNSEAMDEELVTRVKAASFDFLQVPFELLVQQHFFATPGLVALLHLWYCSKPFLR
jgi:hypothetical protein